MTHIPHHFNILMVNAGFPPAEIISTSMFGKHDLSVTISEAKNILEAKNKCAAGGFDIVIAGLKSVTEKNVKEVAGIKSKNRDIPLIVILKQLNGREHELIKKGIKEYAYADDIDEKSMRRLLLNTRERAELKKSLENEEKIFRSIVNSINQGLILIDRDFTVSDYNRSANIISKKYSGKSIKKGDSVFKVISKNYYSEMESFFAGKKVKDGFGHDIDIVEGIDGTDLWIEYNFSPVEIDGEIKFIWLAIFDVTERKIAIDEVAKSEKKFRSLVKESFDIILIIDESGMIKYSSDSIMRILEYSPRDIIGKSITDMIHPKDQKMFESVFARAVKNNYASFLVEFQILHRSGSYVYIELAGNNLLSDTNVSGFVLNLRNITDRKHVEAVLERINRQRELILESAGEGIFGIDSNGIVTFVNQAASALLMKKVEEMIGDHLSNIIRRIKIFNTWYETVNSPISDTLKESVSRHILDATFDLAGGGTLPVEFMASPIVEKEKVLGAVVTFSNISERKKFESEIVKAKEEAEKANHAKSEFLAKMSHELRTPLNSIIGFIDLMKRTRLERNQMEYASIIEQSSSDLMKLINDILDLSRIEKKKLKLDMITFNPHQEFESMVNLFSGISAEKNIRYCAYIDPSLPRGLKGDPLRINQILINLLGNAMKFTPSGGMVSLSIEMISFEKNRASIRFSVRDNGIGIEADKKKSIFKAFEQADSSVTRMYGGSGLGLAISNGLVKQMGGRFDLLSEKGKGSEFFFELKFDITQRNGLDIVEHDKKKVLLLYKKDDWQTETIVKYLEYLRIGFCFYGEHDDYDFVIADRDYLFQNNISIRDVSVSGGQSVIFSPYSRNDVADKMDDSTIIGFKPVTAVKLVRAIQEIFETDKGKKGEISLIDLRKGMFHGNVLIGEDNKNIQKLLAIMLDELGFSADFEENGIDVFEKYKRKHYDIILMDVNMPVTSGIESLKMIRNYEKENSVDRIPVIALTAKAISGDRENLLSEGMDDYIAKPFNMGNLVDVISKFIKPENIQNNIQKDYNLGLTAAGLGISDETLISLINDFFETIDEYLHPLGEACEKNDFSEIRIWSHKLKGSTASYNFVSEAELLAGMEQLSEKKIITDYKKMYDDLIEMFELRRDAHYKNQKKNA